MKFIVHVHSMPSSSSRSSINSNAKKWDLQYLRFVSKINCKRYYMKMVWKFVVYLLNWQRNSEIFYAIIKKTDLRWIYLIIFSTYFQFTNFRDHLKCKAKAFSRNLNNAFCDKIAVFAAISSPNTPIFATSLVLKTPTCKPKI